METAKHLIVYGATGSGKTTTIVTLLDYFLNIGTAKKCLKFF